ncbi:MAG: hypothetical protein WC736_15290 [Gallionella sp.]
MKNYYEPVDPVKEMKGFRNGLAFALLLWFLIIWLVLNLCGCSSVQYGDMKVSSLGTDVHFKKIEWVRNNPDGSVEHVTIQGVDKNASESAHTAANMVGTVVGACVGGVSSGGAGTAAGASVGAAAGLGLSEAWQTVKDWWNKRE